MPFLNWLSTRKKNQEKQSIVIILVFPLEPTLLSSMYRVTCTPLVHYTTHYYYLGRKFDFFAEYCIAYPFQDFVVHNLGALCSASSWLDLAVAHKINK